MNRHRTTGAVTGLVALMAGVVLAWAPSAQASPPPYEPGNAAAVGTVTFYNAAGDAITGGSITDKPFAAYAVGSAVVDAGDSNAVMRFAQPNPNALVGNWNVDDLSAFTAYPVNTGPANIQTLSQSHPVATGAGTDLSISDYIGEFPNGDTSGPGCAYGATAADCTNTAYQNLYQVRLVTAAGANQSTNYDVADILVSGTTWTQVYPVVGTAPGAPTSVQASAGITSATVSWTAPADNGGATITGYDVQYSTDNGSTWTSGPATFHTSTATSHLITGLTAGTSYVFRVAAINSVSTGAYSAQSAAVVPAAVHATSLAIGAPRSVAYGRSATITAKLTDTTAHVALGGAHVTLYRRAASNKPWAGVKTVTTSSSGAAGVALTLTGNTQLQYRYAGDASHKAVNGAVASVAVTQTIAIHATPTTVKHGGRLRIWGTVAPAGSGQKVTLQKLVGRSWKWQATATIKRQKLPNGRTGTGYIFSVKLATKGTFRYRVTKAATSTLAAGTSPTVTVKAT